MNNATFSMTEIGPRPAGVPAGHWWCHAERNGRDGVDLTLALPIAGTRGQDYVTRYCVTPEGWFAPCAQAVADEQERAAEWAWAEDAWQTSPGGLWVPPAHQLAELYPCEETGLWSEILGTVGGIAGAFVGGAGAPAGAAGGAALGAGIDAATSSPTAPPGSRYRYRFVDGPVRPPAMRYRDIRDPVLRRELFVFATELARRELRRDGGVLASPWDPALQPSLADIERRRGEILRTYARFPDDTAGGGNAAVARDAATAAAIIAAAASALAASRSSGSSGSSGSSATPSGGASSRSSGSSGTSSGSSGTSSGSSATSSGSSAQLLALLAGLAGAAGGSSGSSATSSATSSAPVSPQTAATVLAALRALAGGTNAQTNGSGSAAGADALAGLLRGVLSGGGR